MSIRQEYYDDLNVGPFMYSLKPPFKQPCVIRTASLGATIAMTNEEGRMLGRLLVKAINDQSATSQADGPWRVEVLAEDWEWEGAGSANLPVCVTYDERFEFILSWEDASTLAEDYEQNFMDDSIVNGGQVVQEPAC